MKTLERAVAIIARSDATYLGLGFAIITSNQAAVEANFSEKYGGEPTEKEWAIINDDTEIIEWNALKYLKANLDGARDEGHGSDEALIGSCWCKWDNKKGLEIIEAHLDADPNELSSEEDTAFYKGTSDLAVVDATLDFFDVSNEDKRKLKELGYYNEDIEDEDEDEE